MSILARNLTLSILLGILKKLYKVYYIIHPDIHRLKLIINYIYYDYKLKIIQMWYEMLILLKYLKLKIFII